jgi:hypothetical protein
MLNVSRKKKTLGVSANRNEQFENINNLIDSFDKEDNPILSIDSKKKEIIGEYSRANDAIYGTEPQITLDHDFKASNTQTAVPHGIYDYKQNKGYITVGNSSDTSEFVCDNIKAWWFAIGILLYPYTKCILILCDGGGSNSSRHFIFKEDLQKLAWAIGRDIRIAHYPPYCSKWNPIEHRLFPHVSKAIRGANFTNIEMLANHIKQTKTTTGLDVTVSISDKIYKTGRVVQNGFKKSMPIQFDEYLPKWNYVAKWYPIN